MKNLQFLLISMAAMGVVVNPFHVLNTPPQLLTGELAAKDANYWLLARSSFSKTDSGLVFDQTEMGTPDNHAISILEVPFDNTASFEIKFKMKMDEYVASGRNANDVWAGIGIMGKPTFVNWRNTDEEDPSIFTGFGRAKDSPGLFTRFFNYSGDLRYEGSVYQEDYHTLGEASTPAEIVDTWRLFEGNASASIQSEVTLKLSFDKDSENKEFYNVYLNGTNITPAGEAAFIERDVIFPEGKIYLSLVMNTQEDDFNELSKITVTAINGESYLKADNPTSETSEPTSQPVSDGTSQDGGNNSGCFATTITSSVTIIVAMIGLFGFISYRRHKLIKTGAKHD